MNKISGINVLLWSVKTLFLRNIMGLFVILFFVTTNVVSALTFSNIEVVAIKDNSIVIRWDTDTVATGQIEYGTTVSYGDTSEVKGLSYWQQIEVTGLTEGTGYHFRLRAVDYDGNETISEDSTFTTRTQAELEIIVRAARTLGDLPKVYYMKFTGNDSYSGLSIDSAWATLSYAQFQLQPGDTLLIEDGTYTNALFVAQVSGIPEAPIVIKAYNGLPTFIESGTTRTLRCFNFHDTNVGTAPGPISYYNIEGLNIENYYRAIDICYGSNNININDISTNQCNNGFFAGSDCHHIITSNMQISNSHWNSWYIWHDNYNIMAINVYVTNQIEHSFFDLHTNNDNITLINCSAIISSDNAPGVYMGHGDYGTDDNVSIINFTYTDVPRENAINAWNPVNNLYIEDISCTDSKGVQFMGTGTNLILKNVYIKVADSVLAHGVYFTTVSNIDDILLENVTVENVKTEQYYYDIKFESGFDVIKNVTMRDIYGDNKDYTFFVGDGVPIGSHCIEYSDGTVFSETDNYTDIQYYPDKSNLLLQEGSGGTITYYPVTLRPTISNEYLTVSSVTDSSVTVESTVTTNPTTIGYTNADYANYNVILIVDGVDYDTSLANDSGTVFHNYNENWTGGHTFTWKKYLVGISQENDNLPKIFALHQNFPNPFTQKTVISYQVAVISKNLKLITDHRLPITLKIYDLSGRLVKTLVDREQKPGYYKIKWDGKDNTGKKVATGIYFLKFKAGKFETTKKLTVMH